MSNTELLCRKPLEIKILGSLTTDNADECQREVERYLNEIDHDKVILNFSNLKYISSRGLRMLMKLIQDGEVLEITQASLEVYDTLELTAFTQIIPVSRKRREVSIEDCEVIGTGQTGIVYRLDEENIVKVFMKDYSEEYIKKEAESAKLAFLRGINTAISYDIVQADGQLGLVYELIEADTIRNLLRKHPESMEKHLLIFADLVRSLHSTQAPSGDFPSELERKMPVIMDFGKLGFSEGDLQRLKEELEKIPERRTLIHGDLNGGNVLIHEEEGFFIDMSTLSYGHPILDLASVLFSLSNTEKSLGMDEGAFQDIFLKDYFQTDSQAFVEGTKAEIKPWISLIQAYGMYYAKNYFTPEQQRMIKDNLLEMIRKGFPPLSF